MTAPGNRRLDDGSVAQPILVWNDALRHYDFGPGHPLTPLRFEPGVDLMRAVGAERFVEPEQADDGALLRLHAKHYVEQVRSFSEHPWQPAAMGVGSQDVPAFHGMHEVSALVAGGSIGAVERILAGEAEHAISPAGASVPKPTHAEVPYGDHERHVLDFWKAESDAPTPLAFVIHGGGWQGGSKERLDRFADANALLEAGISVAAS